MDYNKYKNTKPYVPYDQDKKAWEEYHMENSRLAHQFSVDLIAEYDMQDHPKRDAAFFLAWELGIMGGLKEVEKIFEKLVELLK